METIYDWITVSIFAGLIVLFLQRSTADESHDSIWLYLAAALGCAVANYSGNEGYDVLAWIIIVATLAYIVRYLKPFGSIRPH